MSRMLAFSAFLWCAVAGTALAETRVLGWADLIPQAPPLVDPLRGVDLDVRRDLLHLARVRIDVEQGFLSEDSDAYRKAQALIAEREAEGVDLNALTQALEALEVEIERRGADVEQTLDGQMVRMPGYALPLEFGQDGVQEFLLVPFVGACIHVPPPPPNQMVYVDLDDAVMIEGLFQPVWVTGRMLVEHGSRSLFLVDGQADVATGYVLEDVVVEPYR